jgi:hypothetical protein
MRAEVLNCPSRRGGRSLPYGLGLEGAQGAAGDQTTLEVEGVVDGSVHDAAIDPFRDGKPSPLSGRTSLWDALHHPDRFSGHHGK